MPGILHRAAMPAGSLPATNTNDNAIAGTVGEYVSSAIASGSAVDLTVSDTTYNVTSISLTAGDWDVWAQAQSRGNPATTVVYMLASISTTSATQNSAADRSNLTAPGGGPTLFAFSFITLPIGPCRISLAATTTIYLVAQCGFGTNTAAAYGTLHARRAR